MGETIPSFPKKRKHVVPSMSRVLPAPGFQPGSAGGLCEEEVGG